jgi:hypothetical protein
VRFESLRQIVNLIALQYVPHNDEAAQIKQILLFVVHKYVTPYLTGQSKDARNVLTGCIAR